MGMYIRTRMCVRGRPMTNHSAEVLDPMYLVYCDRLVSYNIMGPRSLFLNAILLYEIMPSWRSGKYIGQQDWRVLNIWAQHKPSTPIWKSLSFEQMSQQELRITTATMTMPSDSQQGSNQTHKGGLTVRFPHSPLPTGPPSEVHTGPFPPS